MESTLLQDESSVTHELLPSGEPVPAVNEGEHEPQKPENRHPTKLSRHLPVPAEVVNSMTGLDLAALAPQRGIFLGTTNTKRAREIFLRQQAEQFENVSPAELAELEEELEEE